MGAPKPPSTVTQTNKVELSPEQKKLFNLGFPYAEQYAQQPLETYGGETLAGFTPLELAGQAGTVQAAGAMAPNAAQALASNQWLMNPSQLDPASNPYARSVADQISSGISDELTQRILPAVRTNTINSSGMFAGGDTRGQMADHLAGTAAMDSIGNALEKFYFDNYKLGVDTMGSAIDRNQNVMASSLMPSTAVSTVGQQQRQMEQAELDQAYNQWIIDQQMPFMRATDIMSLVQGMPGATSVTQMQGLNAGGGMNPMMSMMGMGMSLLPMLFGGMGGAGAGGLGSVLGALAFLSDEKAKTNIQKKDPLEALEEIKQLDPITYEYTPEALAMGAPEGPRTGFTAQALEAATGTKLKEVNGFKTVDMPEMIGRLALALIGLDQKVEALEV
jgi:hypothetical protein